MYAVFGMTPQLARRRVKVPMKRKDGTFKSATEHEEEVLQKISDLLAKGRREQPSPIYGAKSCAAEFAQLAVDSGGGRIEIRARVNDGEPVFDKKKKIYVQKLKWETVWALHETAEREAC